MTQQRTIHRRPNGSGSKNKASKLNEERVAEIRRAYRMGGTTVDKIATALGISHHTAHSAIFGNTWKHVGGEASPVGGGTAAMRKLTEQQVTSSRKLYAKGACSIIDIQGVLGLSFNATRMMVLGLSYQHIPMPDAPEYESSLNDNIVKGLLQRLHLSHQTDAHKAACLAFSAGTQHGRSGRNGQLTEEEVMGAGNGEYDNCRLGFEDLQQLSHAYSDNN